MKIRYYISYFIGRSIYLFMRLLKRNASNFPGIVSYKICPDFLKYVKKPKLMIGVTGTNGKTSTCNLLGDFFKKQGKTVMCNSYGSNLRTGIIACFLSKRNPEIAVLEIDELASYQILPYLDLDYFIVTNLFRDSLQRNAHSDYIFNRLNSSIKKSYKLVLNADDVISSRLCPDNKRIYFGVSKLKDDKKESDSIINDAINCPICYNKLDYDYVKYHHIGHAHCSKCGFESPKADYLVKEVNEKEIVINDISYHAIAPNITNVYNEVAILCVLKDLNYSDEIINETFNNMKITDIRLKRKIINNIELIKIAIKGQNGVSGSRVFEQIKKEKGNKQIILITDEVRDASKGEIVSWLYETDFEYLNNKKIDKIIVGGDRRFDNKLRLLLANIPDNKIKTIKSEYDTYKYLDYNTADKIYIVHDVYNNFIAAALCKNIEEKLGEKNDN